MIAVFAVEQQGEVEQILLSVIWDVFKATIENCMLA